jgi:hypothetical protein
MSLIHIAQRLRVSTKDWKTFLSEKYEGGKKKVRNPNHDTAKKYPEISLNTALKDESFRHHIEAEYEQWKGSDTEDKKQVSKYKNVLVSEDEINRVYDKYEHHFDSLIRDIKTMPEAKKIMKEMKKHLGEFFDSESNEETSRGDESYYRVRREVFRETATLLSDKTNQMLIPYAHLFSKPYKQYGPMSGDFFRRAFEWKRSSGSSTSLELHKYLESVGVEGSYTYPDTILTPSLGELSTEAKKQITDAYAYQQAVFKHLKITHVTLYRGLTDDQLNTEPPNKGDKVQVKTRHASSWTSAPTVGIRFGNRIVKCVVPVENILMSPMTYEHFGNTATGEHEYVVMGAEGLDCEVHTGVIE